MLLHLLAEDHHSLSVLIVFWSTLLEETIHRIFIILFNLCFTILFLLSNSVFPFVFRYVEKLNHHLSKPDAGGDAYLSVLAESTFT